MEIYYALAAFVTLALIFALIVKPDTKEPHKPQ